jgi:hypothetical protein
MRKLQLQFMVDEVRVASSCLIWSRQLRLRPRTARYGSVCPTSSNFVKPGPCYLKGLNGRGEFAA